MTTIMTTINTLKNLVADESGATAIEYGLIAALVSVAAITALTEMGSALELMFQGVAEKLQIVAPGT